MKLTTSCPRLILAALAAFALVWLAPGAGGSRALAGPAPGVAGEPTPARAVVTSAGRWPGLSQTARTRAIDQAFAAAIGQQLDRWLTASERAAHQDALDRDVTGRARLYVASYRVAGEQQSGGQTSVTVEVTLDLDKLGATLNELGLTPGAGSGTVGATPAAAGPAAMAPSPAGTTAGGVGQPTAILLLKVTTPSGTITTFGQGGGSGGEAGAALARELDAMGFSLRQTAGQSVAVSASGEAPEGDAQALLPVGDQAAVDLARRVGASAAWVVGIDIRPDGTIRGTHLLGAAGRAAVRVLDATAGNVVAQGQVDGAGYDAGLPGAAEMAARELSQHIARAVESGVTGRWPPSGATRGGPVVLVHVRGARTWNPVAALIHRLGGLSGVSAVDASEVTRGRITLAVATSLAPGKLAAALLQTRLPSGRLSATPRGDQVEVEIRGETTFAPSPDQAEAEPSDD